MWPFKSNKSSDDDDWEFKAVPLTTLARWYIYDLDVEDANKLAVALELTPSSPEGDEKERQDSYDRIARIDGMMTFFHTMADINAKVVFQVQKDNLPPEMQGFLDRSSEELEQLVNFYESMSFAAILSAFSTAAELGLVQVAGKITSKEIGE